VGELVHETYRSFVTRQFGAAGRAWLDTLPTTLHAVADEWDLELGPELHGGVLACVLLARSATGEEVVVKVAGPWDRPRDEIGCLRRWNGRGAPRLLHADPYRGAFVLERIRPAAPAADASAEEVAHVLAQLHVEPLSGVTGLDGLVRRRLDRALDQGRATQADVEEALRDVEQLVRDAPPPVLLHGDFDDRNLLHCERRGLAAIDPLPANGDPAYDAAHWAHANRRPGADERIDAIAQALGADAARIRRWAAVVAVHG
jgi:streptomycin 6-kinase